MVGARVGRVFREQVEVVELATPSGLGVHLLEGDHVCLGAVYEARHLYQVEVGGSTPPGPTKFVSLCFYLSLFFRIARFGAFLCVDTTAER